MRLKKMTATAILTAAALVVFVIESQLPAFTSVPGIKLGLSNVFTLFALYAVGTPWAFALLLLRVFLGGLLTGQLGAVLYSLSGGLLAFAAMLLFKKLLPESQIWVVSVFGAIFHNLGQLAAALAITGTKEILWYLPILLVSGILTGAFTGLCAQLVLKRLRASRFI
jgi:heptaprenyl diphosphate synthase